jgi:MFS family permease
MIYSPPEPLLLLCSLSYSPFPSLAQHRVTPQWRQVVAVTAGCLLLCNLHRSTFAVLLPDLAVQLGLRASQAGAVQAAMLAAYLVGQVPAGRLADKYSGTR